MTTLSVDNIIATYKENKAAFDANEGKDSARLDFLTKQEKDLRVTNFGVDEAWELGSAIYQTAHRLELPVAIDIRLGMQRAFHAAIAGSARDNDDWANRKENTVMAYGHSSFYVGTLYHHQGDDFDLAARRNRMDYVPDGGAFPVMLTSGLVIGVVAASGLPSAYDHSLVTAALKEFITRR